MINLYILLKSARTSPQKLTFAGYFPEKKNAIEIFPNFLKNSKAWDQVCEDNSIPLAAKIDGKVFLPDHSLAPMAFKENRKLIFGLSQFGKKFLRVTSPISKANPLEIELFPRGNEEQLDDLVVDLENIPDDLKKYVKIDLKFIIDTKKRDIQSLNVPLNEWKWRILERFDDQKIEYYMPESSEADAGVKTERCIGVSLHPTNSEYEMIDQQSQNIIKAKTFMKFKVMPRTASSLDPSDAPVKYEKLKNAFKHNLTQVGDMSLSRLRKNLTISYSKWRDNYENYASPLVTLCQSSGSGKSKLSIECIKRDPGFYLVFRDSGQTGYPRTNLISEELLLIISGYNDKCLYQADIQYSASTVGKIIDFFVRVFVSYIREICVLVEKKESLGSIDLKANLNDSINEIGSLFFDNEMVPENFSIIGHEEMKKLYIKSCNDLSVKSVARFFVDALEIPELCLENVDSDSKRELYGVDVVSKIKREQTMTMQVSGLEILRRALRYLEGGPSTLFLIPSTKSDVLDLNPPIVDLTARFMNRKNKLSHITLTGNSNIFSEEFPITELQPSYTLLRNPFMFKFLSTLGHGLWSAYPFSQIIATALIKLKNASAGSNSYFLPVWMLRTGLSANPLHSNSNYLVAGHMATLHDVHDDLKNLIVSYPSEPILAIAGRELMSENLDVELFDILKSNTEALSLDIGRYAKVFGAMIVLRALDETPNFATTLCHKYDQLLDEIKSLTPNKFHPLWEKEPQLLEVPENSSQIQTKASTIDTDTRYFDHYKVFNVGDFLRTLIKTDELDKFGVPKSILNGIINANHFVTLTRDNIGFEIDNLRINPFDMPSADDRISDNTRNIIDSALLKIGLLRQCGFALPTNYYGLDFILPVCLENSDLTFIGIQVKRSSANVSEDVYKMRSRLHLVKCPNNCASKTDGKGCKLCLSDETLQNIHGNHLSLLISLDDVNTELSQFSNSIKFRSDHPEDCKILSVALVAAQTPKKLSGLHSKTISNSFLKPLARKIVKLNNKTGLAVCLWDDRHVALPNDSNEVVINNYRPDNFVHRQYTIMTRGWNVFRNLFWDSKTVFKIANDMMSNDGIFRHAKRRSDAQLIRSAVYDSAPSCSQYSDELLMLRGKKKSNLDLLNEAENREFDRRIW